MSDWDSETRVDDLPDRNHEASPLIGNAEGVQSEARNLSPSYYADTLSNFRVIAILGATGAGKSTFIQRATGSDKIVIGDALRSCTKEVSVWPTTINGINVALLDTPGFDDTHRSDAEMLEDVATWLAATFEQNILLSGVIFLEPVNTTRVSGSEHRRIRLFEKICGKHAFSNIVIASTMWSSVSQWPSSRRKVRDLMKQRLKTPDFWGHMTLHGARYEEHADTKASAHKIIRMLLDNEPKPLQLQVELQGNGSRLYSTTAGRIVADDLEHTAAYLSLKIKALKEEQMSPGSEADDLLEYLDELERNLEKLQEEQKRLRVWKALSGGALQAATIAAQFTVAALMCNVM